MSDLVVIVYPTVARAEEVRRDPPLLPDICG